MSPSEQLSRLPGLPESPPEPTGPAGGTCHFAGPADRPGPRPAAEWEGYDLSVLDAILEG
jgi:hypothetical protein